MSSPYLAGEGEEESSNTSRDAASDSTDGSPCDSGALHLSNVPVVIVQPPSVERENPENVTTFGIHLILPQINVNISESIPTSTSTTSSETTVTAKTATSDQHREPLQPLSEPPTSVVEPVGSNPISFDSSASIEFDSDNSVLRMGSNEDTDYEPLRKRVVGSATRPLKGRRRRISARRRNARRACKRIRNVSIQRSFQEESSPPRKRVTKRFLGSGAACTEASTSGTRTGGASTSWSGTGTSVSSRSAGGTNNFTAAGTSGVQSRRDNASERDNSSKSYKSYSTGNTSYCSWSPERQILDNSTSKKIEPFQKSKLTFKRLINSYMSDSSENVDSPRNLSSSPKEVLNFAEKLMSFLNEMTLDYVLKTPPINGFFFMNMLSKNSSLRALVAASSNVTNLCQYDVVSISFPRFLVTEDKINGQEIGRNVVDKSTNTEEDMVLDDMTLDSSEEKEEDNASHTLADDEDSASDSLDS